MNELFSGLDYVRKYIYDLLIISNDSLKDHVKKIDTVLIKLNAAGFNVNAEIGFFQEMN